MRSLNTHLKPEATGVNPTGLTTEGPSVSIPVASLVLCIVFQYPTHSDHPLTHFTFIDDRH